MFKYCNPVAAEGESTFLYMSQVWCMSHSLPVKNNLQHLCKSNSNSLIGLVISGQFQV